MQMFAILGAALLALLALSLPALAHKKHWNVMRDDWRYPGRVLFGILISELGASILYTTPPNTPSATALTGAQAAQVKEQIAQITFADGDTQQVFTHNWQLPSSFPTFGLPFIQYYWLTQNASPTSFQTAFTFGITNTNSVTVNKTSVGVGSGGVLQVILRRGDGPYA
jgi:ABC-type Fe3+-siderophore transport system permease subunit